MKRVSQNKEDRLSDLPESIILHILSFLSTKQALQTMILSTRWKNIPKYLPTLELCFLHFKSLQSFGNFVSQIFTFRDDSTALHTLNFNGYIELDFLENIVEYAISHNVRLLKIYITRNIPHVPSCFFSSQTVTSLDLSLPHHLRFNIMLNLFPSSLNLPALTHLTLKGFNFDSGDDGCAEPFSALNKLNTLTIKNCGHLNAQILCISSTTLVNLTMYGDYYHYKCKIMLSAPSLCNFAFSGTLHQNLCISHPCSVKHFYIDVNIPSINSKIKEASTVLFTWLLELANIESLKVSSNTLQVLSFDPDLFKVKLTSLCNLETLHVEKEPISKELSNISRYVEFKKEGDKFYSKQEAFIPDGLEDFLILNSLSAKLKCAFNFVKRLCF